MTKARNWVEEPATQVVCFICQRMTARAYKGKKDAFDDAGVWFQNKDSWQRICWCPRCIFDLQEPDAALRSWLSRDPRYHTEDWEQAEGLTEEMVNQFMRNWRDPPDGPQPPRPFAEILEEESRPEEADGTAAPPPPPAGARPPASDANDPPGPPLGDGPQAAIGDIQGGVGPGHGAAGAEGAPRSSRDSSHENVPPEPPPGDGPQAAIEDIQEGAGPGHGAAGAEGAQRSSRDSSHENVPPEPPPGDGPQAAIGDIQEGVGPGHGAAGAEGAPRSSGDSSRENEKMKNLEQKVEELSGKLQRHTEFVQDFKSFCEFLEKKVVGDAYVQISELHNEVKSLGQQVAELKGEVSELKKGAERTDEGVSKNQQFSTSAAIEIMQLKQEVLKLQNELSWWHEWHKLQPDRTKEC